MIESGLWLWFLTQFPIHFAGHFFLLLALLLPKRKEAPKVIPSRPKNRGAGAAYTPVSFLSPLLTLGSSCTFLISNPFTHV